jgi:hypothetical protein
MLDKESFIKAEKFYLEYLSTLTIKFSSYDWLQFRKGDKVMIAYSKIQETILIHDDKFRKTLSTVYNIKNIYEFTVEIFNKHLRYQMVSKRHKIETIKDRFSLIIKVEESTNI